MPHLSGTALIIFTIQNVPIKLKEEKVKQLNLFYLQYKMFLLNQKNYLS